MKRLILCLLLALPLSCFGQAVVRPPLATPNVITRDPATGNIVLPAGTTLNLASGQTLDLSGGTVVFPTGTDGSGLVNVPPPGGLSIGNHGEITTAQNGSITTSDGGDILLAENGYIRTYQNCFIASGHSSIGDFVVGDGTGITYSQILSGPNTLGALDAGALTNVPYPDGISVGPMPFDGDIEGMFINGNLAVGDSSVFVLGGLSIINGSHGASIVPQTGGLYIDNGDNDYVFGGGTGMIFADGSNLTGNASSLYVGSAQYADHALSLYLGSSSFGGVGYGGDGGVRWAPIGPADSISSQDGLTYLDNSGLYSPGLTVSGTISTDGGQVTTNGTGSVFASAFYADTFGGAYVLADYVSLANSTTVDIDTANAEFYPNTFVCGTDNKPYWSDGTSWHALY